MAPYIIVKVPHIIDSNSLWKGGISINADYGPLRYSRKYGIQNDFDLNEF